MSDRPLTGEPLFTPAEAAAKLNISVKQLKEHVRIGRLRFINVGVGKVRKRYRFTSKNIATFIENQKERMALPCPSTKARKAPSTSTISKSTVVAFSALQKPGAKKTLN